MTGQPTFPDSSGWAGSTDGSFVPSAPAREPAPAQGAYAPGPTGPYMAPTGPQAVSAPAGPQVAPGQPVYAPGVPVPGAPVPGAPVPPSNDYLTLAFRPFTSTPAQLTALFTLLAVLGSALVSGILLSISTSGLGKNVPGGFDLLPVAVGMTLSGHLNGQAQVLIAQASFHLSFLALGTLAFIAVAVYQLARRRRHLDGSVAPLGAVALRSGAEALAVSVLTAVLLGFLSTTVNAGTGTGTGTSVNLQGSFIAILLVVLLLVFAALFLGRAGDLVRARIPALAATPVRELGAAVRSVCTVMAPVALVGGTIVCLTDDQINAVAALPVYLGNLVVMLLALGSFGAVRGDSGSFGSSGPGGGSDSKQQFAWDLMGAWFVLLLIVMVLLVVFMAARVGARRPRRAAPDLTRTWQLPVLAWGVAVVFMHLLAPMSVTASAVGNRVSGGVSLSWWSSLTFALVVAVASVLAEYVPALMYGFSPPLLRLCAGSAATESWLAGPVAAVPAAAPVAAAVAGGLPVSAGPAATGGYPVTSTGTYPAAATGGYPEASTGAYPAAPVPEGLPVSAGPAATGGYPEASTGAYPAAQQSQAAAAPAPMDPATRKRVKVIGTGLGALILLAAAGAGTVAFLNSSRTPQAAVQHYLQLIADGKASEANAVVDPGVPNEQRKLLTDEVLQAAKSRITVGEVKEEGGKGDTRHVTANVSIDGKSHDLTIDVRKGPKEHGLLNTWKIDTPAVQKVLIQSDGLRQVVVSGATLDFPERKGIGMTAVEQYAYFGVYDIALPEGQATYLKPVDTTLTVEPTGQAFFGSSRSSNNVIKVEATDKLKELVLKAVKEQAEACVKPENRDDEKCPWKYRFDSLQSLSVKETGSDVEVSEDGTFSGGPVTFSILEPVTTWRPNPKPQETKFDMKGTITFPTGGGEPTIKVTGYSQHIGN